MDMTGERFIRASKSKVWAALNNTEILKTCIPGCESLEALSDTQMKAAAAVKLGPISAKFTGDVTLSDLDPPNGYTISGEGRGGVAGFAKGGAKVCLADQDGGTMLRYIVNAQVGGKIAQLGARLIDATAKSMAEQFFTKFAAEVEPAAAAVPQIGAATTNLLAPAGSSKNNAASSGGRMGLWLAVAVVVIAVAAVVWQYAS
jgi:carbon monoxide dehydrogenase subunit G